MPSLRLKSSFNECGYSLQEAGSGRWKASYLSHSLLDLLFGDDPGVL